MSWQPKSLDELGFVSRGRSRHRPRDAAHLYGGPHPFVQTGDVKHAGLYLNEYSQTYSEAGLEQSRMWPQGTLCITIAANIADTAILGIDACFPDSVIGFIPDESKADARFVKYLFDAMLKKRFKQFTQGAAQDNLSQGKLLSLKFPIPSVAEQRRIASILSAYDDLIENNRRRIQLLEQAARLLYKEWFVHLRFPGHEHTKMIDGVPEGWRRICLGDLCKLRAGDTFKPKYQGRFKGDLPFIKVRDLNRDGNTIAVTSADNWVSHDDCEEFRGKPFSKGTSVFAKIGEGLRQNRIRFINRDTLIDNNMMGAIPDQRVIVSEFLYFLLQGYDLASYAGGAAIPFLSSKVLESLSVLAPAMKLLLLFQDAVSPMFQQIVTLELQSTALAKARDLLLPKLMNGEVAV
jgi:type I restriction enzyme S subunit